MEPQSERLPPWVTTYLDDMKVAGEIDPVSVYTLMLYGDRQFCAGRAEAFAQRFGNPEHFSIRRTRLVNELIAHADTLIPHIPAPVWAGLLRSAVVDLNLTIRETAEWMCGWAVEDACEGGASLPFRRAPRAGLPRSWWPTKKAQRRLRSPRFMRNYMHTLKEIPRYCETARRAFRLIAGQRIGTYEEEVGFFDLLERQGDSTLPVPNHRRQLLNWASEQGLVQFVKGRKKKRLQHVRRKKLSRAATFAAELLGPKKVGEFIRGEYVEIQGQDLTFLVGRQTQHLEQCGHGCLSIALKATMSRTPLGVICFYIEGTPVLDQLAAIALHAEAGTEREILAISNVVAVTSAGADHPFMMERRTAALAAVIQNPPDPEPEEPPLVLGRPYHDARDIWERRRAWYWEETGQQWVSIFKTALFGRHAATWDSIRVEPRNTVICDVVVEEYAPIPLDLVA